MNFRPDTMLSKLILLYVFDKIEIALTENTIMNICWSSNNWLNYMEIVDILPQLIEMNFVNKTKDADGEERYVIAEQGRKCLELFYSQIPEKLRDEITNYCRENRMDLKRSQEYVCSFVKLKDDNYMTTLKIKDITESNAIDIKIKFPTRNQAVNACKMWKKNAPFVYASIYEALGEKETNDNKEDQDN
ncbi:MAG: DUF4364 family protein [Clostridiales bacterium]|nr:DUF4364 family protein [Clostridiales bacterium]